MNWSMRDAIWPGAPLVEESICTHPPEFIKSMPGQMGTHGYSWWRCYACGEEVDEARTFQWRLDWYEA